MPDAHCRVVLLQIFLASLRRKIPTGFEMMECSIINSSTTAAVKQIVPLIGKDPMQIISNIFIFLMTINIDILKT